MLPVAARHGEEVHDVGRLSAEAPPSAEEGVNREGRGDTGG
jgi:hypothetical protein